MRKGVQFSGSNLILASYQSKHTPLWDLRTCLNLHQRSIMVERKDKDQEDLVMEHRPSYYSLCNWHIS